MDIDIDQLDIELETRPAESARSGAAPRGVAPMGSRERLKAALRSIVLEIVDEHLAERRRMGGPR